MVSISFVGDISLNDEYTKLIREGVQPFRDLNGDLAGSDFVVGNLECLATGNRGENLKKKPRLKTDLQTLGYLKQLNVGMACLAHNHVYDNLEDGFIKTLAYLERNNIRHLGASLDDPSGNPSVQIALKGMQFAFFNYVDKDTNPSLPDHAGISLSILDKEKILHDLSKSGEANFRILILHWGGRWENSYFPGPKQISLAREFISAGADLIIGHHPHTLQPSFSYMGKSVFFSLGNFCFADIKSDDRIKMIKYRRSKESAILKVEFTREGYRTSLIPFRIEKLHTVKDRGVLRRLKRRQWYFNLIRYSRLLWYIYYFGFKYLRPVIWELGKKDPERNLIKKISGLNKDKVKGLFK